VPRRVRGVAGELSQPHRGATGAGDAEPSKGPVEYTGRAAVPTPPCMVWFGANNKLDLLDCCSLHRSSDVRRQFALVAWAAEHDGATTVGHQKGRSARSFAFPGYGHASR
jgi:hypothetical protein